MMIYQALLIGLLLSAPDLPVDIQAQQNSEELLRLRKENATIKAEIETLHNKQAENVKKVEKLDQIDAKVNAPPSFLQRYAEWFLVGSGAGGVGLIGWLRRGWLMVWAMRKRFFAIITAADGASEAVRSFECIVEQEVPKITDPAMREIIKAALVMSEKIADCTESIVKAAEGS